MAIVSSVANISLAGNGLSQWVGRDLFTMAAVYTTTGSGYTTFKREGASYRDWETKAIDRKSTRLNSSHRSLSRMPSSA